MFFRVTYIPRLVAKLPCFKLKYSPISLSIFQKNKTPNVSINPMIVCVNYSTRTIKYTKIIFCDVFIAFCECLTTTLSSRGKTIFFIENIFDFCNVFMLIKDTCVVCIHLCKNIWQSLRNIIYIFKKKQRNFWGTLQFMIPASENTVPNETKKGLFVK